MIKIIHLSDLHFSSGAIDDSSGGGHNFEVLCALTEYLKDISFDKLIITGDLTDSGTPGAFQNVSTWLSSEVATNMSKKIGLKIEDSSKFLVVPGNHDLYDNEDSIVFPNFIQKQGKYYYKCFLSTPFFSILKKDGISIVFFGIDSGKSGTPAKGEIDEDDLHFINLHCNDGRRYGLIDEITGFSLTKDEFKNAVKVLVLHHHFFKKKHQISNKWLKMQNTKSALSLLFINDFSLALSGHKHIDYFDSISFSSALDNRSIARYAYYYLARKNNIMKNIRLYRNDGKLYSRKQSFVIQLKYFAEKIGLTRESDLEEQSIRTGLKAYAKKQFKNYKSKMEELTEEIVRNVKNIINNCNFNYIVGNTTAKIRGPSASYIRENSFNEITFKKEDENIFFTIDKHFYDNTTRSFKKEPFTKKFYIFQPIKFNL